MLKNNRKLIKIYAERNTGSVYLEWLLMKNLKIKLANGHELGWKRRIAPSEDEISRDLFDKVIFVCLVKNPYSWLLSMHRRPKKHEELQNLTFSDFIRTSFGDYKNPVQLWNIKNQSYLDFQAIAPKTHLFRYEKVLAKPQESLNNLSEKFQINKTFHWFKDITRKISSDRGVTRKSFHKEYYLRKAWRHDIKVEDIRFINGELKKDLVDKLNYSILGE